MIQQITLRQNNTEFSVDVNKPIELVMSTKDILKHQKIIEVLFDQDSVERIMKERRG